MKIQCTVNGQDLTLNCDKRSVMQTIKVEIDKQGKDWMQSSFFVPHWPAHGRYISKSAGFITFGSGS